MIEKMTLAARLWAWYRSPSVEIKEMVGRPESLQGIIQAVEAEEAQRKELIERQKSSFSQLLKEGNDYDWRSVIKVWLVELEGSKAKSEKKE